MYKLITNRLSEHGFYTLHNIPRHNATVTPWPAIRPQEVPTLLLFAFGVGAFEGRYAA
jgi:hypothetical protein